MPPVSVPIATLTERRGAQGELILVGKLGSANLIGLPIADGANGSRRWSLSLAGPMLKPAIPAAK